MFYYVARAARATTGLSAALLVATLILTSHVAGAESSLQAVICRDTPATMTIARPESDSVVSSPDVELSGDVTQSGELEIYVDDAYNSVEPLPYGGDTYATTVHLSPGTHTIKVVAIDTCQIQNATASIVLTYQPVSVPSVGGKVRTDIGGVVTGLEQVAPQKSIFKEVLLEPLVRAGEGIDLVTRDSTGTKTSFANTVRFGSMVIGLLVVVFAQSINASFINLLGLVQFTPSCIGNMKRNGRRIIAGIGIIIIILVFMI